MCSKNRLGENGSLFKVNGGRGPYETIRNNPKTTVAVFPRGPKKVNPTMTTNTVTAKRKGGPQHYVEEELLSIHLGFNETIQTPPP